MVLFDAVVVVMWLPLSVSLLALMLLVCCCRYCRLSSVFVVAAEASVVAVVFRRGLLRGPLLNRTYGTHKNLYISGVCPTIFGPICYGPPQWSGFVA